MRWPTTLVDRFDVSDPVAEGGMGTVHRGTDRATGLAVAIKIVAPQDVADRERFGREISALAALAHPGIVRYIADGITAEGEHFLVMEWIEGSTLASVLASTGVTIRDGVAIARRVAEALAEAHRHGLVHRDVKPENIMLPGGAVDRVRIVDFGLARLVEDDQRLTRTGFTMGTPGYMAPEQVHGSRALDGRADIFALGCVLYECVTGRPAFAGDNPMAIQVKVLLVEPPPPAVGGPLATLIARMLAKRPDDRPSGMIEVAHALAALAVGDDVAAAASEPSARPTQVAPALATSLVIAAPARPDPAWPARARAAAAAWVHELVHDNTLVIRIAGARDAARCALALVAALPEALFAVSTPLADDQLDGVIDRSTRVMSVAALRAVFARGAAAGKIHLDAATAASLRDTFDIVDEGADHLLRGERHA